MNAIILTSVILGLTALRPENCNCFRILGVFPYNGRSRFIMFEALMKGLARTGHQVDVVSPFPQTNPLPNYTDIINLRLAMPAVVNNLTYDRVALPKVFLVWWVSVNNGNNMCANLGHQEMQKLIRHPPQDPPYDLVITEFLTTNCFIALGHHLKVPTIGMISSAFYPWNNRIIANPPNLAFVPNNLMEHAPQTSFWQRMYNTVNAIFDDLYFQYLTNVQDEFIKKYFGEDAPGVREVERTLALVMINTHYSLNGPRPMTPASIEVGGLHVQDDGPELPEGLKEWLDDSTDGFIYFTFGSMVQIESFPETIVRTFYKSLGKVAPIRVLMKVPNPEKLPSGLPNNIRTFKWASQMKVLKHKNIKTFITHGGLMGIQEAIHCAVPLIGIPIFADQYTNVDTLAHKKIAIKLNYQDITEKKFDDALNAILYDSQYKNRMLEMSAQFYDRPMTPMDTAIWWVEYVIRNGGQDLRSPALDLHWWQIELFDVYAVFLLLLIFLVFVTNASIRFLLKRLSVIGNSIRVTPIKNAR